VEGWLESFFLCVLCVLLRLNSSYLPHERKQSKAPLHGAGDSIRRAPGWRRVCRRVAPVQARTGCKPARASVRAAGPGYDGAFAEARAAALLRELAGIGAFHTGCQLAAPRCHDNHTEPW